MTVRKSNWHLSANFQLVANWTTLLVFKVWSACGKNVESLEWPNSSSSSYLLCWFSFLGQSPLNYSRRSAG
ncbi:hypothetical protein BDZ97DRAFT_1168482 [Flammula alnicola]|nr:hypothetical protein BDZ97DRAFT_1168482 [Flammula alnicola]